jgi:hypothetical protein
MKIQFFVSLIIGMFILDQIPLSAQKTKGELAVSTNEFLNSIGVCVHVQHGQNALKMAEILKYTGIRNIRDGADRNYITSGLILLHKMAGVHVVIGPGSGAHDADLQATIVMARELHENGALLAIEGPNEPNNFGGVTYQGEKTGISTGSWLPAAKFQRDLYSAVKQDTALKKYQVFGISEVGAETDNTGLQFLTIPNGASTLMPDGTTYADYANVHNYMYHDAMWPGNPHDNQVWNAADPSSICKADGLYNNHGRTWRKHFQGYSETDLWTLPRVTTETGVRVGDYKGQITEEVQGNNYLNLYLAQFKRGWSYTFIYEFLDDPDGSFGFYKIDYVTPRKSALYLHNFTEILSDSISVHSPGKLNYSISNQPGTTHSLLLQKSNKKFEIVIWSEKISGSDDIIVTLDSTYRTIYIYDPTIGIGPVQTINDKSSIGLKMTDHPIIIELAK